MSHNGDANKKASNTPRTDAVQDELLDQDTYTSWLEMSQTARQLERELNAANARIKRLEETGDGLKAAGYFGGWADAVSKWVKIREEQP